VAQFTPQIISSQYCAFRGASEKARKTEVCFNIGSQEDAKSIIKGKKTIIHQFTISRDSVPAQVSLDIKMPDLIKKRRICVKGNNAVVVCTLRLRVQKCRTNR
jgi:hypothetical protein